MKGHQEKIKEQDYLTWLSWQYGLSAVSVAIEHNLAGHKARSEYIKEPLMQRAMLQGELTEAEKQREVDMFFAEQSARRMNWRNNRGDDYG